MDADPDELELWKQLMAMVTPEALSRRGLPAPEVACDLDYIEVWVSARGGPRSVFGPARLGFCHDDVDLVSERHTQAARESLAAAIRADPLPVGMYCWSGRTKLSGLGESALLGMREELTGNLSRALAALGPPIEVHDLQCDFADAESM